MRFTSSVIAAILLLASTTTRNSVEAFTFTPSPKSHDLPSLTKGYSRRSDSTTALFLSPEDLTNAMAKAHEEKIRAIKDIEDKKNAEIQVSKTGKENI
jgi:hypothetical protein